MRWRSAKWVKGSRGQGRSYATCFTEVGGRVVTQGLRGRVVTQGFKVATCPTYCPPATACWLLPLPPAHPTACLLLPATAVATCLPPTATACCCCYCRCHLPPYCLPATVPWPLVTPTLALAVSLDVAGRA